MEFLKSKKYSLPDSIDYVSGGVASKQVLKKETGNITLFSFDEGEGLSEHTSPYDAVIHLIEGQAEITIGQEKFTLGKDEFILLPASIPHAVHAVKKFKMLLVMIKSK
ncbi:MAG: cupin domain-containing protein [Cyclobacteriaceae bacterium]|nr:cupin domain-containing protein [Cyclobacteriaceae bacterium]